MTGLTQYIETEEEANTNLVYPDIPPPAYHTVSGLSSLQIYYHTSGYTKLGMCNIRYIDENRCNSLSKLRIRLDVYIQI